MDIYLKYAEPPPKDQDLCEEYGEVMSICPISTLVPLPFPFAVPSLHSFLLQS